MTFEIRFTNSANQGLVLLAKSEPMAYKFLRWKLLQN